ncbi:hypothetical protein B0H66DRAFT_608445 [Apodospora peruviana]|uniref:Uncharacterized protein n=1 Tax=Apodospora peruviana TaxID=516989 RepID=A0AAE0LYC8_9PEZI|nr:hypothetical protein B0H66DRAFT_608445 [Apodospora peruviana]
MTFRSLVLFAALAAAAPSTIPRAQQIQASNTNCTTNSFSIPSWFINNFHAGSNAATFSLLNRVTSSSVELTCQTGEGAESWSTCAAPSGSETDASLQASIQVKAASAVVQVKQSWSCDDRNTTKPVEFTASGNTTVPLSCDTNSAACKSANPVDLIKGSLLAPVAITPDYASGPDGHANPGCVASSKTPTWTLGTVIFINETGSDQLAIQSQSIQFHVVNQATGYSAGCLMYFSAAEGEDPAVRMTCDGGSDFTRRNRYSYKTETVFYPRSWTFGINQTWFCDDVDAARPISYSARGTTTLSLKCSKDDTTTSCEADAVTVHGEVVTEENLAPYSIEDPLPTADGCTVSSVVSPSWILSNFEVEKSSASRGAVSFNMKLNTKNNLFDYPVFVNHNDVDLQSADEWYPCAFGPGELPLAPKNCTFRFDEATNRLDIKADWVCIDVDAVHPVLFSGIATTTLPKLNCVTAASGLSTCGTSQGYTWISEVANTTWRTLDGLPARY